MNKKIKMVWLLVVAAVMASLTFGCNGDFVVPAAAGNGGTGGTPRVCDPGSTKDCACTDGRDGSQACEDSGMRYGACDCTDPVPGTGGSSGGTGGSGNAGTGGAPPVCEAGIQRKCTASNGDRGTQVCKSDGTRWLSCQPIDDSDEGCIPGQADKCGGPGGCDGAQVCDDDRRFGDCECPPDGSGGTGGTGGSSGNGGTGGSTAGTGGSNGNDPCRGHGKKTIHIVINSTPEFADHLYCMGQEVVKNDHRPDLEAQWFLNTGMAIHDNWEVIVPDGFDGRLEGTAEYCADHGLRFQCYLKSAQNPDQLRYVFAIPSLLKAGETVTFSETVTVVENLRNGHNGQAD